MKKEIIFTDKAPKAIGTYSQAVRVGNTIFLSGQIPLLPDSMEAVQGDIRDQIRRVFENLNAVAEAADGNLNDIVKLTVYLTDLSNFPIINEVMGEYFAAPYPARAAVGVAALPKGVGVEIDGIMMIEQDYSY